MIYDHICRNCKSADLRPSRVVNLADVVLSPVLPVYRCMVCAVRQRKFRSIKVGKSRPAEKVTYVVGRS